MKQAYVTGSIVSLSLLFTACGKKSSDTTDQTATANGISTVKDVGELKLSKLNLSLPAAFSGTAAALRLTAAKKSMDACQMGSTVNDVVEGLGEIASMACHIEVEKDKIIIGKKTKLLVDGQEFGRILVARDGDTLSFNMCQTGEGQVSKQQIIITKITSAGPAGSIVEYGTGTNDDGVTQTFNKNLTFDLSVAGIKSMMSLDKSQSEGGKFLRQTKIDLLDSGVSKIAFASKGTWQGQTFAQRGAARLNGSYGATLFQNEGTSTYNGQSQTFDFTQRSKFDAAGLVVADDATADFLSPSGSLYVTAAEVPAYVTAATVFATATGWVAADCSDTEVEVTLDPKSAAHAACDGSHDHSYPCSDNNSYESGVQSRDLD